MDKTTRLLSCRFSKNNPFSKARRSKLTTEEIDAKIGSHNFCPSCGVTKGALISKVDRVGFWCDTVVCSGCDLVFNDSYILEPLKYYASVFGKQKWQDPELNFLKRTSPDAYAWKRLAYVTTALGNDFHKVQNVIEIGCGDGCNLYPYHLLGLEVTGFDFGNEFLEVGRKRGMNLIQGDFSSCKQQYDLILLVHSFEHMLDLDDVVSKVHRLLKNEGVVYVEVPGLRNLNRKNTEAKKEDGYISSNNFLGYLQYQHNYHFDLDHLKIFWERNGFEIIQGDEWIRALFKKGDSRISINRKNGILSCLQAVEKDFLSPRSLVNKISRRLLNVH
jgi:SAM-dependent methyltransferase